ENDLLPLLRPFDGVIGREHHLSARRARRGGQASGRGRNLLPLVLIESGREQLVERLGIDEQTRLLWRQQLLVDEVGGDADGGVTGALAAAGLQHEQPLVLDRELEVLHVLVMLLEARRDLAQLLVGLRHHLLELADRLRRADPGDDVFALRVDQELAVELFLSRRRTAGEGDARRRSAAGG